VGLSLFFLILVDNYLDKDGLAKWDMAIYQWVDHIRTPLLNKLMMLVTLTANWQIIFWGLILGVILLGLAEKWRYAWAMLISVSTGILFTELTKMFIARPRPPVENAIIVEKGMAFPSGHSYFAIVFYGLITYFWVKHFRSKWMKVIVGILGAGLCLLIGISRIYLGVHWTTDVLAGFASSLAWLILTILYLEYKNKYFASEYKDFNHKLVWRGFWLFTGLWLAGIGVLFISNY
jgi:undecaprenyl-diphosphatase